MAQPSNLRFYLLEIWSRKSFGVSIVIKDYKVFYMETVLFCFFVIQAYNLIENMTQILAKVCFKMYQTTFPKM